MNKIGFGPISKISNFQPISIFGAKFPTNFDIWPNLKFSANFNFRPKFQISNQFRFRNFRPNFDFTHFRHKYYFDPIFVLSPNFKILPLLVCRDFNYVSSLNFQIFRNFWIFRYLEFLLFLKSIIKSSFLRVSQKMPKIKFWSSFGYLLQN